MADENRFAEPLVGKYCTHIEYTSIEAAGLRQIHTHSQCKIA